MKLGLRTSEVIQESVAAHSAFVASVFSEEGTVVDLFQVQEWLLRHR